MWYTRLQIRHMVWQAEGWGWHDDMVTWCRSMCLNRYHMSHNTLRDHHMYDLIPVQWSEAEEECRCHQIRRRSSRLQFLLNLFWWTLTRRFTIILFRTFWGQPEKLASDQNNVVCQMLCMCIVYRSCIVRFHFRNVNVTWQSLVSKLELT